MKDIQTRSLKSGKGEQQAAGSFMNSDWKCNGKLISVLQDGRG